MHVLRCAFMMTIILSQCVLSTNARYVPPQLSKNNDFRSAFENYAINGFYPDGPDFQPDTVDQDDSYLFDNVVKQPEMMKRDRKLSTGLSLHLLHQNMKSKNRNQQNIDLGRIG